MKAKPVILSGGSGVRLWPISRKNLAKQFVDLFQNDSSLFMETIKRVANPRPSRPRTVFKTGCKMYYLILKINMGPL